MKKSRIIGLLFAIEMLVCIVMTRIIKVDGLDIKNLLVYPFVSFAENLFDISKSGNNFLAWLILIEVSLIPIMILVVMIVLKKFRRIHIMLPVLSLCIFFMSYIFINPSVMVNLFGKNGYYSILDLEIAICYVFYILVITYIIALLIGIFKNLNEGKIIGCLQFIIIAIGMLLISNEVYLDYILSANSYRSTYKEISEFGIDTSCTKLFYGIKYIVELVPCIIYIIMAIKGIDILDEMKKDRFSDTALKKVKTLSKISMWGIGAMLVVNLVYNIATIICLSKLYGDYRCFEIPGYLIVFSLCILLFAKYMEDTKQIKEDNDMFV